MDSVQDAAPGLDTAPELVDAASAPHHPVEIRRADYRPFAWLVPEIELSFDLAPDSTLVTSKLTVVRNAAADAEPTIRLNGEGLELKIGRAACRERVCQYVYISVVGGSLKKKK